MKFWLPFSFLFVSSWLSAQDVVLENNPPSIKWSQVNTKNFRIIFPNGFTSEAQRLANTLEHIRDEEAKSLGSLPRKLSVILQNQSSVSNGFVSVLPRRSEFYTMPSQDYNFVGTNDWLDILASHEYRHVVQYQHANRGFNRLMFYLFGAGTYAGMAQAAAPDWFWEGDAVATETAFTRSGRGKIPNFSLLFKTNLLEGRTFNYHKQYLRSYKHNIPDHYVFGYHMVSYLRKRTNDPEIWGKISARAWSVPFIPFIFSTAIKRESGMHVTQLYREMAKDLKRQWQQQIDSLELTSFETLTVSPRRAYTDYQYPQSLGDGSVLAMKSGIADVAQFVLLKDGREKKVFTPGLINESGMLSAHGRWVVWNEYGFDPRWNVRTHSLIKAYDLKSKRRMVIGGKNGRYGSVAISRDESKLVAVRTDQQYQTRLVILSMPDGKVIKEFPNPDNAFYSMPTWSTDNRSIICLKTNAEGKAIVLINTLAGSETEILPYSNENVGYPIIHDNFVLYNSPVTGIDNIFAIDVTTKKKYQVTSSKYGAYNPSISEDGKKIYYNDQTKNGLSVVAVPFDRANLKSYHPSPHPGGYEHLVEQEGHPDLLKSVPGETFPVTKYSKLKGLFNPYTWGTFFNNDLTGATVGISSQDLLSTTSIDLGYVYDLVERASSYRARVSYQGLYPIIDVSASYANRSVTESFSSEEDVSFDWKESNLEAGLRVPLVTTSSRFVGGINSGVSIGLTRISDFTNSIDTVGRIIGQDGSFYIYREYADNGNLSYGDFELTAFRLMKRARRDINSKWGQQLNLKASTTAFNSDFDGALFGVTGILYFPGLLKSHSIWGYGAFQHTLLDLSNPDLYIFQNEVPVPRGLSVSRFENFYSASANYTMPVWYPDIAIGPLLNIQRLRTNLFYDYGLGTIAGDGVDYNETYTSVGIEAKVDFNILRFLPQIDLGVRYTVGLKPAETRFEVLIGTINF
jgi:hypothetical protein